MKRFDISTMSDWRPAALVCLWSPGEDHIDYVEMLMDDIAEWMRADRDIDAWDYDIARKMADPAGRFANRGSCDHCGAHFLYGGAFKNAATDEIMIVGNICAAKLGLETDEYADKMARDKVRLIKARIESDRRMAALVPNRRAALENHHQISMDLRSKFRLWHSLSVGQWGLAKNLVAQVADRAEAEAENPPKPIPAALLDGRHEFSGEILGFKREPGFGYYDADILKMIFRDDRGFKLYGTTPSALFNEHNTDDLRGMMVRFAATVERSNKDETFGFFKRPTKAAILEAA